MNNRVLLNLGCGQNRPEGWINTDSSFNSFLQKLPFSKSILINYTKATVYNSTNAEYMDLSKLWKFTSSSIDVVYASHVFEHLTLVAADLFMSEAYRVLKPNGIIRIIVPDLYKISKEYVLSYEQDQEDASQKLLYCLNLNKEGTYSDRRNPVIKLLNLIQGYPHQHKYMYDTISLRKILASADFLEIQACIYAESKYIPEIKQVEFTEEGIPSIYFEAKKPVV